MDPLIGQSFSFAAPSFERDPHEVPRGGNGSQVLPVADLDDDFDGRPEDGMEYLFMVRREAAAHSKISRVANPYASAEPSVPHAPLGVPSDRPTEVWRLGFVQKFIGLRNTLELMERVKREPRSKGEPRIPGPKDEQGWREFIYGRTESDLQRAILELPPPTPKVEEQVEVPKVLSELEIARAAAFASLDSLDPDFDTPMAPPVEPSPPPSPSPPPPALDPVPATADSPPSIFPPQEPTPKLMLEIDSPTIIHVLEFLNEWLLDKFDSYVEVCPYVPSTSMVPTAVRRKRPAPGAPVVPKRVVLPPKRSTNRLSRPPLPDERETGWILSLLTRLHSLLDGDDISSLRMLVKTLLLFIHTSERANQRFIDSFGEEGMGGMKELSERERDEKDEEGKARCWMVVAIAGAVWGQTDLWNEAA